nr:phosphate ABC transporter permease family protein [Sneathiella glossodoripedis]
MSTLPLIIVLLAMCAVGYWFGSKKALQTSAQSGKVLGSRPHQFGIYVAIWGILPPLALLAIWAVFSSLSDTVSGGIVYQINTVVIPALILVSAAGGLYFGIQKITPSLRTRILIERVVLSVLVLASTISVFTTIGIVFSLLFETVNFFEKVPLLEFLTGLNWSPQTALRADQVAPQAPLGRFPCFWERY